MLIGLVAVAIGACGSEEKSTSPPKAKTFRAVDPGPVHVHGLGIDPADGALFIATHTGLFRVGKTEKVAERVAGRYQDTMGFTVVGPHRFLGSGHPDLRTKQPPYLGLISSTDAGDSWSPISLYGQADFHVLESAGDRIVGYGSDFKTRLAQLLVSDDGGRTWSERRAPVPLIDLAISPADDDLWVATGEQHAWRTRNGGRTWAILAAPGGLLAWRGSQLFHADFTGAMSVSTDAGKTWQRRGKIGGTPSALAAEQDALYVALHDGAIKQSLDGGMTWSVRSRPKATSSAG